MNYIETAATVGFFDGVHTGHRFLLEQLKMQAEQDGLRTAAITFRQHPRLVLQQDYQPKMLNTFDERMQLLAETGIDYCYLIDFTQEFSEYSAQDFIQKVLSEQLNVKTLLVGYDHKFGKNRNQSFEQYIEYGKACGMKVLSAKETDEHISSTVIRRLLEEGNVKEAAQKLAYFYRLEGEVIHGNHLGRTMGFPTANLQLNDFHKIIPHEGVYAARVWLGEEHFLAMAYIGKRPTVVEQGAQRIEANIFDFDRDIYGQNIAIELVDFIRPDIHFQNLNALIEQLHLDKKACLQLFDTPKFTIS